METHTPINAPLPFDESLRRQLDDTARALGLSTTEAMQEAVQEFVANHQQRPQSLDSDWIFDFAAELTASVPPEAWAELPTDLAKNFDHYHYGHPRED